ncbi:MAG: OmpH family outer membrane protein [Phycisphaerales bacterium]|nr:OmpH family outer membrane protein [Phycisphaerales bacterium]
MRSAHRLVLLTALASAALTGGLLRGPVNPANAAHVPVPSMAEQRFASINAFQLVERLVQGERYKPAREAMAKEFQARYDAAKAEGDELAKSIVEAGQESDQGKLLIRQYQAKATEARELQMELESKVAEFNAQQLGEAYRIVIETADQIAVQRGYTHVIATRGLASEPLKSKNVPAAVQEILARPLIRCPAADDLTDAIAAELKIEAAVEEGAAAPRPAPAENK